jgi:hypothetical protein
MLTSTSSSSAVLDWARMARVRKSRRAVLVEGCMVIGFNYGY